MISLFGASGFIGSSFAKTYKDEVFIEPRNSEHPKYNKILFSLGTSDNYNIFTENPTIDFETNVNKLIRILHNCKERKIEITLLSSWFVYGNCKEVCPNEESLSSPKGYYSISKLAAEQVIKTYCDTFPGNFYLTNLYVKTITAGTGYIYLQ